jgi:outer membrane lipopolysaccharide assembly protein LptE/RlpB
MIKQKLLILSLAFLLLSNIAGCGYTTRSMVSSQFKTIHVAQFANKISINQESAANNYRIYKPALETDITSALVNRFILDGGLKISKEEGADLTLKGSLVKFRRDALRYDKNDNVQEYRIGISVDMQLIDNKEDKVLWEETAFTGEATYFTVGPTAKSDDLAVNEALDDLVRRIVERVVDQWQW